MERRLGEFAFAHVAEQGGDVGTTDCAEALVAERREEIEPQMVFVELHAAL